MYYVVVRWTDREINWTDESEAHIARHSVTAGEVEEVIYSHPRLITAGREGTTLVYGTTMAGKYLLVVLSEATDGRWYVVTCREMTTGEKRVFRAKGR